MHKVKFLLLFPLGLMMLSSVAADAQTSRKSVSAAEVNGTFRMNFTGKMRTSANEIKILALRGGKIRVAMDLVYPYTMQNGELMANMATLDHEALIEGDTAVYTGTGVGNCTITIKFVKLGTIKVMQNGTDAACGFGHNVSADGTYLKVSGKKPNFEDE